MATPSVTASLSEDDRLLKSFAGKHRLKIRLDECGDRIIPGKRGQLYFAGGELCLMVIDGRRALPNSWKALGGKLWLGDVSEGLQDVKITGVPLENAAAAIRMCRIKRKKQLTPEDAARRRERLAEARSKIRRPLSPKHSQEPNSDDSGDGEG